MELQHYLSLIRRKWWVLALLVVGCCTTAFVYSEYYVEPVYEASTDLIVNKTSETVSGQLLVDQNSINTNLMLINTYKQIIKSPAIMKKVIESNPQFNLTTNELSSKLSINSMKDTQVLNVSIQDASYDKAVQIVTAVSETFRASVVTIMKVSNVSVLNEADPLYVDTPVNNNLLVLMVFSFLIAVMLGLGIIFLTDYLDDTVKTEHDIEQVLGLTLLSKVAKIKQKDLKKKSKINAYNKSTTVPLLRPAKEKRQEQAL